MTSIHGNSILRVVLIASLLGFAAFYVVESMHWPLVEDSPIMHYVNFLMAHGMRPYSDITDNNMPGAYLTEGWAMHLFGGSDLAWRVYDFALLTTFGVAAAVIARPYNWIAGFLAWGMFLLVHAADGPRYTGQREEAIAVLLMVACAAHFEAVRRGIPWLAFLFGFSTALSASIKPTFVWLPFAVLALAMVTLRRRRLPCAAIVFWAVGGAATMTAILLSFLLRHHALKEFLFTLTFITPAYRAVWPASAFSLIVRAYPLLLLPVLFFALILVAKRVPMPEDGPWYRVWEEGALFLTALAGLLSYSIQHKGFYHHRYTWIAFCFMLSALQLTGALRGRGWRRALASVAILFVSLVCVPAYARLTTRFNRGQDVTASLQTHLEMDLEQDFSRLAGGDTRKLQHQILCLDLVSGCLSAAYHLGLVESTGFTGDLLFFRNPVTPAVVFAQNLFWQRVLPHPPSLFVITTEWFGEPDSFAKIDAWPDFAQYLQANYTQVAARQYQNSPGHDPADHSNPRAYRIYVRKASALAPEAKH